MPSALIYLRILSRGSVSLHPCLYSGALLAHSPLPVFFHAFGIFLSYDKISLNSCVATNRITAFSASLLGILRTTFVDGLKRSFGFN